MCLVVDNASVWISGFPIASVSKELSSSVVSFWSSSGRITLVSSGAPVLSIVPFSIIQPVDSPVVDCCYLNKTLPCFPQSEISRLLLKALLVDIDWTQSYIISYGATSICELSYPSLNEWILVASLVEYSLPGRYHSKCKYFPCCESEARPRLIQPNGERWPRGVVNAEHWKFVYCYRNTIFFVDNYIRKELEVELGENKTWRAINCK